MKTTLYDLTFEIDGDDVTLEQSAGIGDVANIILHRCQFELIAGRMGLPTATLDTLAEQQRKIAVLADRLTDMTCAQWFREQIVDRCQDGVEMLAKLDAITDLALEVDGGRLIPSCDAGDAQEPPHDSEPLDDAPTPATHSAGQEQLDLVAPEASNINTRKQS